MFCDVVAEHSFSVAARRNGVTQSTASQIVSHLEKHLGATLIDRSQRPWKPTSEGKLFYEGCRSILETYTDLEAEVKSHHNQISTMVRVACIYSVGLRHMHGYVEQFASKYPRARIHLEYLHPDRIYEGVRQESLDIGVVSFPHSDRQIATIPWHNEPMVIACSPSHPLAGSKRLALSRIDGEPYVGFEKGLVIRKEIDRFLKQRGVSVQTVLEFDNIESIKRAVEIGSGVSILPRPTMDREIETRALVAISIDSPGMDRPLGIIHLRGRPFGSNAARFVELLQSQTKEPQQDALLQRKRHPGPDVRGQ